MQLRSPGRPPPPLPRRAALPRLVHTGGEGALERFEIVNHPDDLGRLLGVILGLPPLPRTRPSSPRCGRCAPPSPAPPTGARWNSAATARRSGPIAPARDPGQRGQTSTRRFWSRLARAVLVATGTASPNASTWLPPSVLAATAIRQRDSRAGTPSPRRARNTPPTPTPRTADCHPGEQPVRGEICARCDGRQRTSAFPVSQANAEDVPQGDRPAGLQALPGEVPGRACTAPRVLGGCR